MLRRSADHRTWPFLSIYRHLGLYLPLVALLGLVASLLEGLGIGLLIPLLDLLLSGSGPTGAPAPIREVAALFATYDPKTRAIMLGGAIFALILLKGIVQTANESLAAFVEGRIGRDVRSRLATTLLRLDYPFFLKNETARLSHIVATDSWFVLDAAQSTLTLIPAAAAVVVFACLLAWLNLGLFLIVLVGAAALQVALHLFERRQKRLSEDFTQDNQRLWERLLTLVQAPRVIRLFGQQEAEERRTLVAIEQLRRNVLLSRIVKAFVHPVLDAMAALLFLVVLLAGYWRGMSIPAVTAFLLLLTRMQPHARAISSARLGIASRSGSLREVDWLLSQAPPPRALASAIGEVESDRPITLDSVTYTYPDESRALNEVSFTIPAGMVTALIGESGSGKTTVVNLLCRLIEPQSGRIIVGGEQLDRLDVERWRKCVAVAGQDSDLVTGTVLENIAYGLPNSGIAEVQDAARAAGAHDFVMRLPQGYDTRVGPTGFSLSGGQRQRIGLARALITRPDLLILDEATNAVDAPAETEIMRLIAEHRYFKTAIIISHRKTTLAMCQHGIVLENGRVVEAGALSDLLYFQRMAGERH